MAPKELMPWRWGNLRHREGEDRPLSTLRREMMALQDEMDRLFEESWRSGNHMHGISGLWGQGDVMPDVDLGETDKAYHVQIELPGMDQKDVEITLADGLLTIRGEKKQEEEEKGRDFFRRERTFGAFRRSLPIAGEIDEGKITASFKKGILSIELPKAASAQKKIKHIDISTAA